MNGTCRKALERLKKGNRFYVENGRNTGDISAFMRHETAEHGQHPYAVVIACADSRVIPEVIFNAGIGELFTIRIAGNVIDDHQLGSIEYAVEHLKTSLVLVLGHTGCGAVGAAIHGEKDGHIGFITSKIKEAIGNEHDERKASRKNVEAAVKEIKTAFAKEKGILKEEEVRGAVYDIKTGIIDWM